jgi:hypothetical protein
MYFGELYVKGRWLRVPAIDYKGKTLVVRGQFLKTAFVRSEDWLESELDDPEECEWLLRRVAMRAARVDLFTFAQKVPNTQPKYAYHTEWDSVAAVRLSGYKEWWDALPQSTRKNVRRAEKRGVEVSVRPLDDRLVRDIVALVNDSPLRQGRRNQQYGKTAAEIAKDYASFAGRSDFICAHAGKELIGLLKLVNRGDVASVLSFVPKASHSDKRPANALLAKAVELSSSRGMSYVTYGSFNYGNKRHSSLREFKVRHGFGEVQVPRYFVPLTTRGALGLTLGIHRGPLGILPESVIDVLVNARAKWYAFRYGQSHEPV